MPAKRDMFADIMRSVIAALLIAVLGGAFQVWVEVKMLRKDVNELRKDLDTLYGETNDIAQRQH